MKQSGEACLLCNKPGSLEEVVIPFVELVKVCIVEIEIRNHYITEEVATGV